MSDAVEAARQHMDQEAANELVGAKRHDLGAFRSVGAIVFPFERDAAGIKRDEPVVGDGDAVGVKRQIAQDRLGSAERALAVDHPFGLAQRRQILRELAAVGEAGVRAEELQAAGGVGGGEHVEKQPAEQSRQDANGQEEARPASDPALAVGGEAAARRDHVDMGMVGERRAPSVQHGGDADPRAQSVEGRRRS